jgi:hypothetical protein
MTNKENQNYSRSNSKRYSRNGKASLLMVPNNGSCKIAPNPGNW